VRQAELVLGKSPVIPEFRCEFGPDASEMDVDLEHENMDQHESCIASPSRAQACDTTMKDDHIDLTLDDSDVHEDGGGVPGEAPSEGDLLGRGVVLHPGPVLTLWTGRRRRRRGGGGDDEGMVSSDDDMPDLVSGSEEEEPVFRQRRVRSARKLRRSQRGGGGLGGGANAGQQGDTSEPENSSITRIFERMWALGGPVSR
jgi:hypothetical protein